MELVQGCTDFPQKIHQKGDMKQVLYREPGVFVCKIKAVFTVK